MARRKGDYALYKGEEVIAIGTVTEIASKMGISEDTVRYYGKVAYQRRLNNRKQGARGVRRLISIDGE